MAFFKTSVSYGSPGEAKTHGNSLIGQRQEDFGTVQNPAGIIWLISLFYLMILMTLLVILVSFYQSCMGQMLSFPETIFFFWNTFS